MDTLTFYYDAMKRLVSYVASVQSNIGVTSTIGRYHATLNRRDAWGCVKLHLLSVADACVRR